MYEYEILGFLGGKSISVDNLRYRLWNKYKIFFAWFNYTSTLTMDAILSSEQLVNIFKITWH
jgi:hypothetical protein